jgi:predicted nucleic acid-binding protein
MTQSKKLSGKKTKNDRYILIHQDILDAMPRDIVQELARRSLAQLEEIKRRRAAKKKPKTRAKAKV